jgi:hypothetical protein
MAPDSSASSAAAAAAAAAAATGGGEGKRGAASGLSAAEIEPTLRKLYVASALHGFSDACAKLSTYVVPPAACRCSLQHAATCRTRVAGCACGCLLSAVC